MPQVRQCVGDSYREIRPESWAEVLGVFGVSEVPNYAKPLIYKSLTALSLIA